MKEENTEEVEEKFIPFYLHKVQIHIVSPHTTFPTMLLFIFFFLLFLYFSVLHVHRRHAGKTKETKNGR